MLWSAFSIVLAGAVQSNQAAYVNQPTVVETTDGGRTWHAAGSPCAPRVAYLVHVSRATARRGWVLCEGQPGTGMQQKALYETRDGGRSWRAHPFDSPGYGQGIQFRSDGHGWLWHGRGDFRATLDGGRTWRALPVGIPEQIEVWSASFVSDSIGYAIIHDNDHGLTLRRTSDGGLRWKRLRCLADCRP